MGEKEAGVLVLLFMILSLVGLALIGTGAVEKTLFFVLLSLTIAFSVIFFGDWFEKEE